MSSFLLSIFLAWTVAIGFAPSTFMAAAAAPTSLEIVQEFSKLTDQDQNYNQAASLLHDDKFKFSSPKESFKTKADWLQRFPKFHKDAPTFEQPQAHEKDTSKVTRQGFKKLGFLKVNVMETYTIDEASGEIVEINAAMTKA